MTYARLVLAWVKSHPWLTLWLAVSLASLIPLLRIEATRANAIVTVWGIFTIGLFVAVVLTEQGEAIQRRAWLRQYAATAGSFLNDVLAHITFVGLIATGVPERTRHALAFGVDRAERARAAEEARRVTAAYSDAAPVALANLPYEAELLSRQVEFVDRLMANNNSLLPRLTEVFGALDRWRRIASMAAVTLPRTTGITMGLIDRGEVARRTGDGPGDRTLRRGLFVSLADTTVQACEQCSDLLVEARLLPRGSARTRKAKKEKRPPAAGGAD